LSYVCWHNRTSTCPVAQKNTTGNVAPGVYILENTPLGGGKISQCHFEEKIGKGKEKKGGKCKRKKKKGERKRKKGERK
jgi:hypothetical protein